LVAYRLPRARETIFTGRVIGIPGDRIQIGDGLIHLNDMDVTRDRMPDFVSDYACPSVDPASPVNVPQWREQLPNGSAYNTLECSNSPLPTHTPLYSVPLNRLFILSHNRRNAIDSRVAQIGYVPIENVVGRAKIVLASMADRIPLWHLWAWGTSFRWRRIFLSVN
jgi:signal peptidase I